MIAQRLLSVVVEIEETLGSSRRHRRISQRVSGLVKRIKPSMMISVCLSGFISLALAAGVFIPARGWVLGFIPLALAAGVFIAFMVLVSVFIPLALAAGVCIAFMVLVSGFIPLALAAGVFIAFTVLASALSAGNLRAIQASLFEPKQRSHETVFLQKPNLVYI